jgi:UDP-2,4-diacetamido-2,4,6-trideoxy-beta-L-altropyranose hydrolase
VEPMLFQDIERMRRERNTLLIRADANIHIGTGHVMRCLALAQAWQDNGGNVTFLMSPGSPSIEQRICSEGMTVLTSIKRPGSEEDAKYTVEVAKKIESAWVIIDGYQFGANYQKIVKGHNCRILFIDDYGHADYYYADIVLNQNIYADMSFYKKYTPYTTFLLGSDFVLLRREFLQLIGYKREIPEVARKVLVTFGGGDPDNITLKVIDALKKIEINRFEVIAVVGGVSQIYEILQQSVKDSPGFSIRNNVTNMSELMTWADVAISAGGSTCWELAFTGLPNFIITLSADQELIASELSKRGISIALGRHDEINNVAISKNISELIYSHDKRYTMFQNGKRIVDGRGTQRIISVLRSIGHTTK